jgi:hypothetical protein
MSEDRLRVGVDVELGLDKSEFDKEIEETLSDQYGSLNKQLERTTRYFAESRSYAGVRTSLAYGMGNQYDQISGRGGGPGGVRNTLTRLAFGLDQTVGKSAGQNVIELPKTLRTLARETQLYGNELSATAKKMGITEREAGKLDGRLGRLRERIQARSAGAAQTVIEMQMGLRDESIQRKNYKDWDSFSLEKKNQITNEMFTASTGVRNLGRNEGLVEQYAARFGAQAVRTKGGGYKGYAFGADLSGGQHGADLIAYRRGYGDGFDGMFAVEAKAVAGYEDRQDLIKDDGRSISIASASKGGISFSKMMTGKLEGFLGSVVDTYAAGGMSGSLFLQEDIMKEVLSTDLDKKRNRLQEVGKSVRGALPSYVTEATKSLPPLNNAESVNAALESLGERKDEVLAQAQKDYNEMMDAYNKSKAGSDAQKKARDELAKYGINPEGDKAVKFDDVTNKNSRLVGATLERRAATGMYDDILSGLQGGLQENELDASLFDGLAENLNEKWNKGQQERALQVAEAIYDDLVKGISNIEDLKTTEAGKVLVRLGLADHEKGLYQRPDFRQIDRQSAALLAHSTQISDQSNLYEMARTGSRVVDERDEKAEKQNPNARSATEAMRSRTAAMGETILNQVGNLDAASATLLRQDQAFMNAGNPKEIITAINQFLESGAEISEEARRRLQIVREGIIMTNDTLMDAREHLKKNPAAALRSADARELGATIQVANAYINDIANTDVTGLSAQEPDAEGYAEFAEQVEDQKEKPSTPPPRVIAPAAERAVEAAEIARKSAARLGTAVADRFEELAEDATDAADLANKKAGDLLKPARSASVANAAIDPRLRSQNKRGRLDDIGEAPLADSGDGEYVVTAQDRSGAGDGDIPPGFYRLPDDNAGTQLAGIVESLRAMAGSLLDVFNFLVATLNDKALALNTSALNIVNLFNAIVAQLTRIEASLRGFKIDGDGAAEAAQGIAEPLQQAADAVQGAAEPVKAVATIPENAQEDIKKPYRELMRQFHPDVYKGENQQDIASHINALKDAGDIAGLRALQNAGDGLLDVINRQREAMGLSAIAVTRVASNLNEGASEIGTAVTQVTGELRESGPEIDNASGRVTAALTETASEISNAISEPAQQAAITASNIRPDQYLRMPTQQDLTRRQQESLVRTGNQLASQYTGNEGVGLAGKRGTAHFAQYQQDAAQMRDHIAGLMRSGNNKLLQELNQANAQYRMQLMRQQKEHLARLATDAAKSAAPPSTGVQPAIASLESVGSEMVAVTEKALVPMQTTALVIRKEATKALAVIREAGSDLDDVPTTGGDIVVARPDVTVVYKDNDKDNPNDDRVRVEVEDGKYREIEDDDDGRRRGGGKPPGPPTPPPTAAAGDDGEGAIRQQRTELTRYQQALEKILGFLQRWQQRLGQLANALRQFATQIGQMRMQVNQAFTQAKQFVTQFAQVAQTSLSRLGAVVDNVGKKFAGFGARVRDGFQTANQSAATLYFLSSTMTQAGSKLSGFGRQQIQKASQFFNEYAGYEMALNRLSVSSLVGADEDGTVNPERGAQISQDFVFGLQRGSFKDRSGNAIYTDMYNAEQVAQAAYFYQSAAGTPAGGESMLASAQGQESMARILGPILNMAAATQTSVEDYIKGVVNIAQQFGYDPSKAQNADVLGNIANVVGQIANITTLEVPDILETFKYIGPQLNMMSGGRPGAGLGDALVLTDMASRAGIKGSMAGRGISQIVATLIDVPASIAKEVMPMLGGRGGANAEEEWNKKFLTADGKLDGGVIGAISKIIKSTDGTPQDVATVLSKIFPQNATRAGSAIGAQIVRASGDQSFLDAVEAYDRGDFEAANRLYEEAMAKTSETVTASVNRVKNAFFQLKTTMFDAVKTPLKEYLNTLANILFELGDTLKNNPFISQLVVGLTSIVSVVATVLGALLTMGGTLFMIQRSFIMAGGSISLFFGIITTVLGSAFALIPALLLIGIVVAALAGHFSASGTSIQEFIEKVKGDFSGGLTQKIQEFSLKVVKALELVTFAFYEFVNTILMGNDVGSNFLGALLGKVFGLEAAGAMMGMLYKVSDSLKNFRTSVSTTADGIGGRLKDLGNVFSVFTGLGQAFAINKIDTKTMFKIDDFGKAIGIDGLVLTVYAAADQIWEALDQIFMIFTYFKGQFKAVFESIGSETETALDTAPFEQVLVLIRSITVGLVAGFLAALLATTQAVAGLVQRLNGLSNGNSRIQELIKNMTGLTVTVEKLGMIIGMVFGAAMAGRMLMMIHPLGTLAVNFAKIGIAAGQVGISVGKTLAMFALQALQLTANLALLALQAAAWMAYIGVQAIAAGVGMLVTFVTQLIAASKLQEAAAHAMNTGAVVAETSAFSMLISVLTAVVGIALILVGVWFLVIAALLIAAVGILAIIAVTEGVGAAFDAAIGFVMAFVDGIRDVINLMSGVYGWAEGFLMASSGAKTLADTLKQIGKVLAWLIGLPVAAIFVVIVAFVGVIVKAATAVSDFISNLDSSSGAMQGFASVGKGILSVFKAIWDIIVVVAKFIGYFVAGIVAGFKLIGGLFSRFGAAISNTGKSVSRLVKALEPLKYVFAAIGFVVGAVGAIIIEYVTKAMNQTANLIDNLAKMIEWLFMAFRAFANGDWIEGLKLLGNVVGQFFVGIIEMAVDALLGMVDTFLAGFELILDAASNIPFIGDEAARGRKAIQGLREDLEGYKATLMAGVESGLTFTVDAEYDINMSQEEKDKILGSVQKLFTAEIKVALAITNSDGQYYGLDPNVISREVNLVYSKIADEIINNESVHTISVRWIDEKTGEEVTSAYLPGLEREQIYYRQDNPITKDFDETGYFTLIDGQYRYISLHTKNDGTGMYYLPRTSGGELGDGRVFVSNWDRAAYSVNQRRAESEAQQAEAFGESNSTFGGIFRDATARVQEIFANSDSAQSLFGFAGITPDYLRGGDLGKPLTPIQIQAMIDAADQSPRARELIGSYLDEKLGESKIYDDAYWERERLKELAEKGLISVEEFERQWTILTEIMNASIVTTGQVAAETKALMEAEEARMNLIDSIMQEFDKSIRTTFASLESYMLGTVARVHAAILSANELVLSNKDKVDAALGEIGDEFFFRQSYSGETTSRPYTTEEMMMSIGGFGKWNPLEDGPLDGWLMNDPDNQAWRDSMIYQGKDPVAIARAAAGDNRWGANTGMRDMVIGEMMTGLNQRDLDSLNRSYLDYRDIASYASVQMAAGNDFDLGTYLQDSGQMYLKDGIWTDIDNTNVQEAIEWMNATYGITLTVDTITDEDFENLRGLIFDDKGQIVAASTEFLKGIPEVMETQFGKIAIMSEKKYAELTEAEKAWYRQMGITVVTGSEDQMKLYSDLWAEQLPQIVKDGVEYTFADTNLDGIVEAYYTDPLTGMQRSVYNVSGITATTAGVTDSIDTTAERDLVFRRMVEQGVYEDTAEGRAAFESQMVPYLNDLITAQKDAAAAAEQAAKDARENTAGAVTDGVVAAGIAAEVEKGTFAGMQKWGTWMGFTPLENDTDGAVARQNTTGFPNGNAGRADGSVGAVNVEDAPPRTTWGEINKWKEWVDSWQLPDVTNPVVDMELEARRNQEVKEKAARALVEDRSLAGEDAARLARERKARLEAGVMEDGRPASMPYEWEKFFGGGRGRGSNAGSSDLGTGDGRPASMPYEWEKFLGGGRGRGSNAGSSDLGTGDGYVSSEVATKAIRDAARAYVAPSEWSNMTLEGITDIFGPVAGSTMWNDLFNLDYSRGVTEDGVVVDSVNDEAEARLNDIVSMFAANRQADNPNLGLNAESILETSGSMHLSALGSTEPLPVQIIQAAGDDGVLSVAEIIEATDVARIMREDPSLSVDQAEAQAQAFVQGLVDAGIVTDGSDLETALLADIETQASDVLGTFTDSWTEWHSIISRMEISSDDFAKIAADNGVSSSALVSSTGTLLIGAHEFVRIVGGIPGIIAAAANAGGSTGDGMASGQPTRRASGGLITSPLTLVGELGRELVSLPMGSRVFSASQTENILGEAFRPTVNMMAASIDMPSSLSVETDSGSNNKSGGGDNIIVNFNGDMNIRDQRDIELLVDEIDRELGRRSQNAKRGMMGTSRSVSVD